MENSSLILGDLNESQLAHKRRLMNVLKKYLPPAALGYCSELIMKNNLHLHIEVERKNKLGDFSPHLGKGNRISINHNLNPYDFLITFAHELAHFIAHQKYGPDHQSHGKEWKQEFKNCMRPMVMKKFFPPQISVPLIRHMQNPKYTHTADVTLMKALMLFDKDKNFILLEQLKEGQLFKMSKRSKVILKKGEENKTYYNCEAVETQKKYLVHCIAKVIIV
ncbi:MAG: SprT-like domain-containing protein [Bacteroidia bacterium]